MGKQQQQLSAQGAFLLFVLLALATANNELESAKNRAVDAANQRFVRSLRLKALHNLQRSLESLSSLTASSLMLNAALQSSETADMESDETVVEEEDTPLSSLPDSQDSTAGTSTVETTTRKGIRRIRADLKEMPSTGETAETTTGTAEEPATTIAVLLRARHLRSTGRHKHGHHSHHGLHKRRRKGCPTVHGKDQLLCPTRNSHRYDVCITREQLCDRARDCPDGEDEDPRHCFFFRPLESSLKTISHAVLLLVDTVMREQEERQRDEL